MPEAIMDDAWRAGQNYEQYMGRWSRRVASCFLDWLDAPEGVDWVDVGCGSGALSQTVLARCNPRSVVGVDQSEGFVAHARRTTQDHRATFEVADARALPFETASVDVASSALVLNFIPDRLTALAEMRRIVRPGGTVAFYVWDYPGGGMGFIDLFWKAAATLDESAAGLDEAKRFPFCTAQGLEELCLSSGLNGAQVEAIEIATEFPSFEDFWQPFTLGAGPAPAYVAKLDEAGRERLRDELKSLAGGDGPVELKARAWAARTRRN